MSENRQTVLTIIVALGLFWVVDAVVDSVFFGAGSLQEALFHPNHYEQYFRALVSLLLVLALVFGLTARRGRSRTREAILRQETQYRILVEAAPDFILIHRDNRILFASGKTLVFFGADTLAGLAGTPVESLIQTQDLARVRERLATVIARGEAAPLTEIGITLPGGSERDVEVSTTLIDFEGQPALLTFFRDISEKVRTRRDLVASRERLQLALEAARDGAWDWDIPSGRMVYNDTWAAMLGYQLEEITSDISTWQDLVHPDDRNRAWSLVQSHFRGETPSYEVEVRMRHKTGQYLWILDRGRIVERDSSGRPLRMAGTHRNITERKAAEVALEIRNRIAEALLIESGSRAYEEVLDIILRETGSPAGLLGTLNDKGDLQLWHRAPATLAVNACEVDRPVLPSDALPAALAQVVGEARSQTGREDLRLTPESPPLSNWLAVPVTLRGQVKGLIVVANRQADYSGEEQALLESLAQFIAPILQSHLAGESKELQLRQAQKMEALGALAGGIAHDFNNILQAIMGFTTLAHEDAPEGSQIASDLERVLKATHRGQNLVQRILLFSRREEQERQAMNIVEVLKEAVDLLTPSLPSTIEIRTHFDTDLALVYGDPSQINQAILNLATNAYHAMESGGGVLSLSLAVSAAGTPHPDAPGFLRNRDLVVLEVSDSGRGISPEDMARLFDPFFTTKEVGKGTGLGLSIVHGIVTAHGGDVVIRSEVDQGTTVKLLLPVHKGPVKADPLPAKPLVAAELDEDYTVLFVDDEEDIVTLGKAMLEKTGLTVAIATDSQVALEYVREDPQRFDLVVTDLTMPRTNGLQLAELIAPLAPNLPVLLITGMTEEVVAMSALGSGNIKGIIRKPFGSEALQSKVDSILRGGGEGRT